MSVSGSLLLDLIGEREVAVLVIAPVDGLILSRLNDIYLDDTNFGDISVVEPPNLMTVTRRLSRTGYVVQVIQRLGAVIDKYQVVLICVREYSFSSVSTWPASPQWNILLLSSHFQGML